MRINIANKLTLQDIPGTLRSELINRFTFVNPKWEENERMNRWNGNTPRVLRFYEETEDSSLEIPRGFIRQLVTLFRRHDIQFQIQDNRRTLREVNFQFKGQLRPFQQEAVQDMLKKDFGTLNFRKTQIF